MLPLLVNKDEYTGWHEKVSHHQFFNIANEIRFLRKIKVWIKHYNTIRW